jgi:hypothetical protein
MPNNCDNCKANPVEIVRDTQGTPTTKLIAILVAHGITSNTELAELVGISDRAVRKIRNSRTGTPVPPGTPGPELQDRSGTPVPKTELQDRNSSSALARAYKESPSEIVITKKDSPLTPQGGFDDPHNSEGVELDANGRVTLVNGVRQFWLDQFGGDVERLSLALLQVSVQPNSRRPIRAQVESQLARQASQRRDQDARYSAAVKSNPRNKPPPDTLEGHYTAPLPDKPLVPVLDEWR